MGQNNRSNWTQEARQNTITRDFASSIAGCAKHFEDRNDPVQCSVCKELVMKDQAVKLSGSNLRICLICVKEES